MGDSGGALGWGACVFGNARGGVQGHWVRCQCALLEKSEGIVAGMKTRLQDQGGEIIEGANRAIGRRIQGQGREQTSSAMWGRALAARCVWCVGGKESRETSKFESRHDCAG
jgi:hypothetical protein